jgi:hypothetical protein
MKKPVSRSGRTRYDLANARPPFTLVTWLKR